MESPPADRQAVKTYVTGFDDQIVRRAILAEIDRGGQVYFVHNRVKTIDALAARMRELVPEARFTVAHGQMASSRLERVMVDFAAGEAEVLVCTAIIENGMDLPNVNTLIADECWMFGLSQLYQLRGRVGRSINQAYAYFLYSPERRLTEEAQKRMQAILEASELGAGFRLAMRDLEIRGAGDLLGADQHGFANAVGFDLYCRMLADAVKEQKGEAPESDPVKVAQVGLPLDAYLPDDYMTGYETKIREYQRLARAVTVNEAESAIAGLRDRFGEFPEPVTNLAYVVRLRAKATTLGIEAITSYGGELLIRLPADFTLRRRTILETVGPAMRAGRTGLSWSNFQNDRDWLAKVSALLDAMAEYAARSITATAPAGNG
jgi:transcription-repair coupling factor (superfamily II helicase)